MGNLTIFADSSSSPLKGPVEKVTDNFFSGLILIPLHGRNPLKVVNYPHTAEAKSKKIWEI